MTFKQLQQKLNKDKYDVKGLRALITIAGTSYEIADITFDNKAISIVAEMPNNAESRHMAKFGPRSTDAKA